MPSGNSQFFWRLPWLAGLGLSLSPASLGRCCLGWWSAASPGTPPIASLIKIQNIIATFFIQKSEWLQSYWIGQRCLLPKTRASLQAKFLENNSNCKISTINDTNCRQLWQKFTVFIFYQQYNDQLCKNLGTIHNTKLSNLKLWYFL